MTHVLAQVAGTAGANPTIDYHAIAPEIILACTIFAVLLLDLFVTREKKWWAMPLGFVGVLGSLAATLTLIGDRRSTFGGSYVVDNFAVLLKVFFLVVALVVLALSLRYFREGRYYQGEYYTLLLSSFLGMLTMPSSRDLLMLFISLELVSAPAFLLAGFRKGDPRSNEAALKFFLIGVLSTAVMLYGMSLIYGVTGTLRLDGIATKLATDAGRSNLALSAILFVVAGFAFKVSAFPFQFWAPDTYEGSPVPVAAFLSVASKAAGFAGLLQLMFVAFLPRADFWAPIFAAIALLTMTLGNLVAIQQRQVVRLLSYSSIAQSGYMLLPFALAVVPTASNAATINKDAFAAAVLYIMIYAVMNLGAFAVVTAIARESSSILIEDLNGLGLRAAPIAIGMTMFMVSLAGIPPFAGFWGKFFIFKAAIERGDAGPWLAGAMVVNSVISLVYYIGLVRPMFFVSDEGARPFRPPALVTAVVGVAAITILAVGVYPPLFTHFPNLSTLIGQ
jgi:NADH-quinone oxidoreductase subunit N